MDDALSGRGQKKGGAAMQQSEPSARMEFQVLKSCTADYRKSTHFPKHYISPASYAEPTPDRTPIVQIYTDCNISGSKKGMPRPPQGL